MIMKKEEGRCAGTQRPKGKDLASIIPDFEAAVKQHDLRTVLNLTELSHRDSVALLRKQFPSFDKTVLSKCIRADKYGCVLHPDGYAAIRNLFGGTAAKADLAPDDAPPAEETTPAAEQKKRSSHGRHRHKCRVAGRLPDDKYIKLQKYIEMEGYETTQDWVTAQVDAFLDQMEAKYGKS